MARKNPRDTRDDPPARELTAETTHRISARVLNVEPACGPGRLFKVEFLGSRAVPLCEDEYRMRQGSRFTRDSASILIKTPLESCVSVTLEMSATNSSEPVIAVLLRPGRSVRFPILPGFYINAHADELIERTDACVTS